LAADSQNGSSGGFFFLISPMSAEGEKIFSRPFLAKRTAVCDRRLWYNMRRERL